MSQWLPKNGQRHWAGGISPLFLVLLSRFNSLGTGHSLNARKNRKMMFSSGTIMAKPITPGYPAFSKDLVERQQEHATYNQKHEQLGSSQTKWTGMKHVSSLSTTVYQKLILFLLADQCDWRRWARF